MLTIGEMVVDFISAEKTDTLSNATTFRRYLGGSPANIAVYVSKLGVEGHVERMIDREALYQKIGAPTRPGA